MIFPNIFGAYSTDQLPNIIVGRDVALADIMRDMRAWADLFNKVTTQYETLLARRTTDVTGNFGSGDAGGEMQPYEEFGETEATHTDEAQWAWGAPIRSYRDRQMYTEQYLRANNLDQLNKDTIAATNRAYSTRLKMLLRALTRNTMYVFNDSKKWPRSGRGNVNVYPLFNADGRSGRLSVNGTPTAVGAMQSYLPSANAAIGIANFNLGRAGLRARGYTGRVMHLVSPADADAVRAIPDVFIPRPTTDPYTRQVGQQAVASQAVVTLPESIGVISNGGAGDGEVVVFPFWPAGYTFSWDATKDVPLVIREHEDARYRGFQLIQDETKMDYGEQDIRNKRWEYIAGAAVENQANGIVVQATTGAYVPPTI